LDNGRHKEFGTDDQDRNAMNPIAELVDVVVDCADDVPVQVHCDYPAGHPFCIASRM
jgi:hypothetical protein